MEQVRFIGTDDMQVQWGSNADPRKCCIINKVYNVKCREIHSWHTKIELEEFPGKLFNNIGFKSVKE